MQNVYNELLTALYKSQTFYIHELMDRTTQKDEVSMIIFVLSFCTLLLLLLALIPVVSTVNRHKNKVLKLFCEIDDSSVRKLSERCDLFIQMMAAESSNAGDGGGQGGNAGNGAESGNDEFMNMETNKDISGGGV